MRDIRINGQSASWQLVVLAKLSHHEMLRPSLRRRVAVFAAGLIGVVAAEVYYLPTRDETADDSAVFSFFATLSTMSTNVFLNLYFNILAVEDIARLKDPVTGQLTIPSKILTFYLIISFISAFSMVFIDVDWEDRVSVSLLVLQVFTYTAQHYTGVVEFMEVLRGLLKKGFTAVRSWLWGILDEYAYAVRLKSSMLSQLESGFFFLNKEFINKPLFVNDFYLMNGLDIKKLMDDVLFENNPLSEELSNNPLVKFLYAVFQLAGLGSQVIANVGYYNSTVNGFLTWFNLMVAWGLATGSITPFYILAFVVSWRSVDKITTFIIKSISALWRRAPAEILDEIPFAIRKTPIFSCLSGGALVSLGALSPFTALDLGEEALYAVNPKHQANFDWVDPNKNYDNLLLGALVAAAVFFNVFPAPYVQEWLSTKYCLLFGTQEEKRAIETLQVLKATQQRVERIPVAAFSDVHSLQQPPVIIPELSYSINAAPRSRECCCTRLSKWFCGLWGRGHGAALELNDEIPYHSLNSSSS